MFSFVLASSSSGGGATGSIVGIVAYVLVAIALWRIFEKAGRPGWYGIIPILNIVTLLQIGGHSGWWVLGLLVPILNIYVLIIMYHGVSKSFGHGVGFTVGLILLNVIFLLILAFNDDRYLGPGGREAGTPALATT